MAWNYEKIKVAPRNSVQNPGLEIFRSLLCVRKRAFPFTVIYVFFSCSVPLETPPDEDWEFVWVPLHAWAEIRSSPKIPLSTCFQVLMTLSTFTGV